ncbi:MAG: hypothetical protein A3K66_02185 [Euryarchaeota archaeon RBG_16_67_27]|nr:MAG: hypothetical protein A3K66_02185 [Euryarchaeota archaeon RBG_16_67_27]
MVLLGVGLLAVMSMGSDAAFGAGILLAIASFLAVFAVLLLFPRVRRQGTVTFRVVVPMTMDDAEAAVRRAFEGSGRTVRTEVLASRGRKPPRVVIADGVHPRFVLEAVSLRESGDGLERTEVVQIGLAAEADPAARELRELVSSALSAAPNPVKGS